MKWRNISETVVRKTVEAPDWEEKSIGQRINAYKLVENRLFKVTYSGEGSYKTVITVVEKKPGTENK